MVNLTGLLDSEEFVLIDTSLESRGKNLGWEIYETINYSQLNSKMLKKADSELGEMTEILDYQNIFTIKEVVDEVREFEKILNTKKVFLASANLPRNKKKREKAKRREKKAKVLLEDIQEKIYNIRKGLGIKKIELDNPRYDLLLGLVKTIEKEIMLKKDTGFAIGEHKKDRSRDSDTDERLVAALYYFSMFGDKNPCLLSQDTDFFSLIGVTTRLIGADSFLPYNKRFRQRMKENPFKFYFKEDGEYLLKIDSSEKELNEHFRLSNLSFERSSKVRNQIEQIWRQLASIDPQYSQIESGLDISTGISIPKTAQASHQHPS